MTNYIIYGSREIKQVGSFILEKKFSFPLILPQLNWIFGIIVVVNEKYVKKKEKSQEKKLRQ